MSKKVLLFAIFITLSLSDFLYAQTYNDGPIVLRSRVREVNLTYNAGDQGAFGVGFVPDELTFKIWGRDVADVDGAGWVGGNCLTDDFNPPGNSADFNHTFFNQTYAGANVPQFLDLRVDAWQDNCGSDGALGFNCPGTRCTFETNCCCANTFLGCVVSSSDKDRCNANPFYTGLDYRLGSPCEWYSHGQISGNCPGNKYNPRIETFWRYTDGTGTNSAIDLGTLTSGNTISHFNSSICYSNNYPGSPGNDVFYQFTVNNPFGVEASLCGVQGAQFDSYIYIINSDGTTVEAFNDDACTVQSEVSTFLCEPGTYYIVVDGTAPAEQGTFTLNLSEDTSFVFEATLNKEDISCNGLTDGTAAVDVVGGIPPLSYAWSVSSSTDDSISGLAAGPVTVSVTDDDNCVVTSTVNIIEPAPLSVNVTSTDVSCSGANDGTATANVSGGTPNPNFPPPNNYDYTWNTIPQQSLQTAVFLGAGSYNVVVTDDNGCVATGTANISTSTQIVVDTDSLSDISCFGNNDGYIEVSAVGGITPYSYSWSNGDSVDVVDSLPPGNYTVTISDADNCFVEEFYTISEPSELELILNNSFDATCYDESDGVVDISTSGGTMPYDYLWSDNSTAEDLINVLSDDYTLTVTDANNCQDTLNVTINQPDSIEIDFTTTDPTCFGDQDGSINTNVSGGTPAYAYTWSDFSQSPNRNNLGAGLYSLMINDLNNCTNIDTVSLQTPPEIIISDSIIGASCNGASDGAIFTEITGGTPPYNFSWGDGAKDSNRIGIVSGIYELTITDINNCAASASFLVDDQGSLDVTLVGTDVRCADDANGKVTAIITGGAAPFDFNWNVAGAPNTDELNNLSDGTYSLTLTDDNGCEARDTIDIRVPTPLVLNVDTVIDAICYEGNEGAVRLSASGGIPPYKFSVFTNQFSTSGQFDSLGAGLYGAIVADSNNCITQQDFIVGENDPFEVDLKSIYYITRGSSIVLEPEEMPGGLELSYFWEPATALSCTDCPNPEASPIETTTYTLTAIDSFGCTYFTETTVIVKRDFEVYRPNAFSPNGDGNNDLYQVKDFGSTDNIKIQIFNRTGELVFETEDINEGWDGTYKGKPLNPDVYVYLISGEFINGEEFDYQGSISLIQ